MKKCSKCKEIKRVSSFFRRKSGAMDGRMSSCKVCVTLKIYAWRKKNPEKWRNYMISNTRKAKANGSFFKRASLHPARRAMYRMKHRYGLTQEQFTEMLKKQKKRCAICLKRLRPDHRDYAVDHCHKTKVIRGILCHKCNMGIGFLKDDPSLFIRACEYLSPELRSVV